ncbi:hypothetical protein E4P82_04425 [Candidatus Competibacter phosphatis]|uniref:CBM20 domain-containing protein n=1 Tax=Candidatus Competibacter phosphatis TaxID=221280 RepID=A0ABX1TGM4_9GAMM|nr:hypothetical protein [Candidatus Competibacter phosphatis]NMQ18507.1 hypothetical protein [Candidatus Competibacter phosphatis]
MPKKKEPTSTPVNKDPKKTTKPTTAAAAATPAASVTPAKAEAPKPTAKPASTKATKAPAAPAKATATAKKAIDSTATVVVAKYDVGFGNKLFIRGEGAGLSWETGVEMKNVENDVWVWTNNDLKKGAVACKFLINDDVWSTGENLFVPAGETSTVFPNF